MKCDYRWNTVEVLEPPQKPEIIDKEGSKARLVKAGAIVLCERLEGPGLSADGDSYINGWKDACRAIREWLDGMEV